MITRKTRFISGLVAVMMLISMFTAFVLPVIAAGESEGKKDVTYSLTIKKMFGEYERSAEVSYHKVGEKLTAPQYEGYELNEDVEKTPVTLENGTFVMPAENAVLVYEPTVPHWDFLEELINKYQEYVDQGYDQSSEGGKDLTSLLINMRDIYELRANMEDEEAMEYIVGFANEAARLYKVLFPAPNYVSISQYEENPDMEIYTVESVTDLEYVSRYKEEIDKNKFGQKQTIRFAGNVTIPKDYTPSKIGNANDLSGLVASIDGAGYTLSGLKLTNSWLGDYKGTSIKNLTFEKCNGTTDIDYGGLLINTYGGSKLLIENVSLKSCSSNAVDEKSGSTVSSRVSLIMGRGKNITFKNIDIRNCSISTEAANTGFLMGQATGGIINIDTVYLNKNQYTKDVSTSSGLIGDLNSASLAIRNLGIFNTTIRATRYGLLTGQINSNGRVTVCENVITAKSPTVSLFGNVSSDNVSSDNVSSDTIATPVNLYSDITTLVRDGEAREDNLEAIKSGEAAYMLNAAGAEQTWAMEKDESTTKPELPYVPKFAEVGMPVRVTFKKLQGEPVHYYTDSDGKLIELDKNDANNCHWENGYDYDSLAAKRFTADTIICELKCSHSKADGTLTYSAIGNRTHTVECLVPDGCGLYTANEPCDHEYAVGDGAQHTKTCSLCGDTITEDCVLTKTQTYENGTYYHTIICDCGYEKKEQCDFDYEDHTQTANGYRRYTCKVCGGHTVSKHDVGDLGTGTVVKKPTYPTADSDGKGITRFVCDDCGYILYTDISALNPGDKLGIVVNTPMTAIDGSTIQVTLELANNPGVSGLELGVTYNKNVMKLQSVEMGVFEFSEKPKDLSQVNGYLPLTFINWKNLTAAETDGKTLATLSFEIIEGAEVGVHSISVAPVGHEMNTQNTGATNENGQNIPVAGSSAMIEIMDYLWGDANGDGEVNILDAQIIIKYEVELIDETAFDVKAANANRTKNGTVDILDALVILRYLAGVGEWDPNGKTFPPYNAA